MCLSLSVAVSVDVFVIMVTDYSADVGIMFDVLVQRENELRKRKTGYLEEHNGRLMEKEQSQGDTRS